LTCSMSTGRLSGDDVVKVRMGERVEFATAREKDLNMRKGMTGWRLGICWVMSASCRHSGIRASSLRVEDKLTTLVDTPVENRLCGIIYLDQLEFLK
jgi:hypothetical protein